MSNAYAHHLDGRDPVAVLRESLHDFEAFGRSVAPARWQQRYKPGKWTIQQILLHVTQWEMILGVRVRCGVAVPAYVVQPLDQDPLMPVEETVVTGPMALDAFLALRRMNLALAEALTPAQRATTVQHPERGQIDVEDLLVTLAGHAVHHWKQVI